MIRPAAKIERSRPRFGDRAMLRRSTSRRIDGLWIGSSIADRADAEASLSRVERGLALIGSHDPVRYRRMLRDLEHIWVHLVAGSVAQFDDALLACTLDERFVLDEATSPELIAAAIVHEATHARLWRCGLGYEEAIRHRVEAICVRREIAFARKLPDGDIVRDQAERTLTLCSDPGYWSNAAFAERYPIEVEETFRYLGVPEILIRALLAAWRWRVAARSFFAAYRRRADETQRSMRRITSSSCSSVL